MQEPISTEYRMPSREEAEEANIKAAKKTISRLGWSYIAGTVLINVLQLVFSFCVRLYNPALINNMSFVLVGSSLITYGIGMPVIYLIARGIPKTVPKRHKIKWWHFIAAFFMCYAMIYISNLIGTLLLAGIAAVKGSEVSNDLVTYVTDGNVLINFVLMVMVAPVFEEFVFRKVIVDRTVKYGQGLAIILSGLMFGLFHGNLSQFCYALVLGMFFAFIYIRTGNVLITMGLHAVVNFLGSVPAEVIFRLLNFEELAKINVEDLLYAIESGAAMDPVTMEALAHNGFGLVLYVIYANWMVGVVIIGLILLIIFRRVFKLGTAQAQIPRGKRFSTLFLNPGMLIFCVIWVILIIIQLLL